MQEQLGKLGGAGGRGEATSASARTPGKVEGTGGKEGAISGSYRGNKGVMEVKRHNGSGGDGVINNGDGVVNSGIINHRVLLQSKSRGSAGE